ncbi:MAG: 4-hydroxy-3-methylbut-2-enyl diphosphate reductase [Verrucomicrobiales bacterium]|jgi:4-hydroxy-3-methylbut-2-enyl diphosphate reductase
MNITLAKHHGMCFGVRDALRLTHDLATGENVTVLGQLVHNPVVDAHLKTLGVQRGDLADLGSASTKTVVITAHGAADSSRNAWRAAGHKVADTTCPLVRKAHRSLECLVLGGYFPVVIGEKNHVEVRGLIADFPDALVISEADEIANVPFYEKIGVVSQTTQPLRHVQQLLAEIERQRPDSEVKFVDTVCQPTKDRQNALEELCDANDTIVVVGGRNSNNTKQLVIRAIGLGCAAYQVEGAADLEEKWFRRSKNIGVTAGTSTLDETVRDVFERLKQIGAKRRGGLLAKVA